MKMDEMVDIFRNKGFKVDKCYHSDTGCYEFTIWTADDGIKITDYFKYHDPKSVASLHSRQKRFIDALVRHYHCKDVDYLKYTEADVANTMNLYKNMVNGVYGTGGHLYSGYIPTIKNVIFNPPATVVLWVDGTKTVVKCQDYEDTFDPEKGLAMAISKKAMGNKGNYYNTIDKWVNKYYEEVEPLYPSFPKIDDSWWEKARTDVTRLQEFIDKRLGSKMTHGSDCEPVADQEAMDKLVKGEKDGEE